MAERRSDQGLGFRFTAKVSHEETSESITQFMAAIA